MTTLVMPGVTTVTTVPTSVVDAKAPQQKSLWDVFQRGCSESHFVKNLVKAFNYTGQWIRYAVAASPELSQAPHMSEAMATLKQAGETGKDIKNLLGVAELPEKAAKLSASVRSLMTEPSWSAAAKAGADAGQVVNSLYDGLELGTRFVPISSEAMKHITAVNHAATLFSSGHGAVGELSKMASNKLAEAKDETEAAQERNKLILNMLNVAKLVSYAAVGVMGLTGFFFGVAFAPWAFTAALTSALVFTFGGYFFDRIVDPENKAAKPELPPVSTVKA